MANQHGILTPTKDEGECSIDVDFNVGKVFITVRAPMAIDKRTAGVSIMDFIEISANITQEWIKVSREINARMLQEMSKKA